MKISFTIVTTNEKGEESSFSGEFPSRDYPSPLHLIKAIADDIGLEVGRKYKVTTDTANIIKELGC